MSHSSVVRRYIPLALVVAVQLFIIAAVPSKAPRQVEAAGVGSVALAPGVGETPVLDTEGNQVGTVDTDGTVTSTGDGGATATPGGTGSAPAGGGTAPAGGTDAGGGGASAASGGGAQAAGDTGHCAGDRQFDPAAWPYPPPCQPKFTGDNGGDTYRGVTKDKIKVVVYDSNLGAAVEAILTAQGSNPSTEQLQQMASAAAKFIGTKFELYGRQLEFKAIAGRCPSVPPDYPCLRNEMTQIVQQEQPFAVIWNTSLASPAFDQLSKLKVVNLGGWGFRDSFNIAHRPYHWDVQMGGTQLVQNVSDWWCKRMHGGGQAKAQYAGSPGLASRVRNLGVISTDDPENKLAVAEFKSLLGQKCGARVSHEYYYAQDITTVEQQRRAAVAKMREGGASGEATSVICFCDLVAPIFLYQTCEEQQYYPEHVLAATGLMDKDEAAQAYDNTLQPKGRQFENAFGLAQYPEKPARAETYAAKAWRAAGNGGVPYESAEDDFTYHMMLATMIQAAGPKLTPEAIEAGIGRFGALGGTSSPGATLRSLVPAKGDYTWDDALREVFWSPTKPSPFNNQPGRYLTLHGGKWFVNGGWPGGLIALPGKPR
jgi:hypothetical protein